MLRDVKTFVTDGLLGLPTEKGTGVHVKIGASPVVSEKPISITGNMTAAKIKERLGLSPLADKVMDSVENGSNRIYCIPVNASIAGVVEAHETAEDNEGNGSVALEGSPNNAYNIIVKITGKGGLNSALFVYSIDGGYSFSEELTVPISGNSELEGTGLSVKFTEAPGEYAFAVDDEYRFTTTAPTMTNADALAAIDKLKNFNELYEFVHIAGDTLPAFWSAVGAKQIELRDLYHKPLAFVLEAYAPERDEAPEDYAFRLEEDKRAVRNYDIQVVAARSLYVGMDGVTREINNAGIVCGLYSKTRVHQSIGKTMDTAGMSIPETKMLELRPAGIENYIEVLDAAKYLMFRDYGGLYGFYVYNARMMSPDGSDYRYMEDVRVKNKIISEVRKEGLKLLHDDIDLEDQQAELESRAAFMTSPLDDMVTAGEISSAKITVPEGQDIIVTETMQVIVRYVSRGYIREIVVDIGRAKPDAS